MPVAHALAFALGRPLRAVVQPLRSSTIVVRAHKHSRDANVTKITRRGFALQSGALALCELVLYTRLQSSTYLQKFNFSHVHPTELQRNADMCNIRPPM